MISWDYLALNVNSVHLQVMHGVEIGDKVFLPIFVHLFFVDFLVIFEL